MSFPDDFDRECLYDADHWYVHELVELDREAHRVVGRVDTTRLGSLVRAQLPRGGHVKHLPGAVVVQVTGTLGNLHAVYAMGLRVSEGWCGYGTHIRKARFPRMGRIGPHVEAACTATRRRQVRGTWFIDYAFRFTQEGELIYESQQTAAWVHTAADP